METEGSKRRRPGPTAEAGTNVPDARLTPVISLVRRSLVTAEPDTPVSEAAARMASERVSCLLVPMRNGWGIVTDRDLRIRIVAARAGHNTPVESVATFPARTIGHDTLAGEALLAMLAQGVHHFPVTDRAGELVGVVTDTDLMGLGRQTPFALKSQIERATSPDDVAAAGRDLPQLVVRMVRARADPIDVSRIVALVVDSMTRRLLDVAIEELGAPPCDWAWLALGSAARHEQALHTDQDHALVHDGAPDEVDPYFADVAERVTNGLEAAGIPRCPGDAMAVHPTLRRPLPDFVAQLATWMDRADPQAAVLSAVGYDFRQVAGPLHAEPALDAAMLRARARPAFVRQMARRALDLDPPSTFWRRLAVERRGEHAGRLDVKHGGITIVNNLARVWAVRAGAAQKDTLGRLHAATEAGQLDAAVTTELAEAFHFLWDVRLHHQARQVEAGEPPDDFVDPAAFGSFTRSGLKAAFRVIERAQRLLGSEESVNPRLP